MKKISLFAATCLMAMFMSCGGSDESKTVNKYADLADDLFEAVDKEDKSEAKEIFEKIEELAKDDKYLDEDKLEKDEKKKLAKAQAKISAAIRYANAIDLDLK